MRRDEPEIGGEHDMRWGSDVAAEMLRRLGIDYICLNPGSSFRGLHDSLVNYLGNERPALLLALHEESAVAIAHGYAKASGRPMAVALHSNVGLMHATMAIYNAWCDRAPILILGATGAVDAHLRRNWIDWVHTFRDQGALVRAYTKWDDQPASPEAAIEAMLRAHLAATTAPCGPAYIILDRRLQEDALACDITIPDVARFRPPPRVIPSRDTLAPAIELLKYAERPVILLGRVSRLDADWAARVTLAERLGAAVITDLRAGATFPTDHALHAGPADLFLTTAGEKLLAAADAILSLDWPDLADALRAAGKHGRAAGKVIHCSVDSQAHNAASMDHQRLPPIDVALPVEPDAVVAPLVAALADRMPARWYCGAKSPTARFAPTDGALVPTLADLGNALASARRGRKLCLARVPLNWPAGSYHFREPLDYLGFDGGGGVGSGPGMTIGAALALDGSGRLVVGVMGDGEFLAAPSALWTGAHYRVPFLVIVANNRSYYTDEIQQALVATQRRRPVENNWIGQRLDDPPIDIAGLARDFGVASEGPVERVAELPDAIERGLRAVEAGRAYLIDVRIDPTRGSAMDWLDGA